MKIADYLLEDIWTRSSAVVLLDCQAGFKQTLWGLGAPLAGVHVAAGQTPSGGLTTAVTNTPECWVGSTTNGVRVFAAGPTPLAMQWTGENLPSGVRDAIAEVLGASDVPMDEVAHEALNWQLWGGDIPDLDLDRDSVSDPDSDPSPDSGPDPGSAPTGPGSDVSSDHGSNSGSLVSGATRTRARLPVASSPSQAPEAAARTLASAHPIVIDDPEEVERIRITENSGEVRHWRAYVESFWPAGPAHDLVPSPSARLSN